jgi:hypothetical protein
VSFHFAANDPESLRALYRVMATTRVRFVSFTFLIISMKTSRYILDLGLHVCHFRSKFHLFRVACRLFPPEGGEKLAKCCLGIIKPENKFPTVPDNVSGTILVPRGFLSRGATRGAQLTAHKKGSVYENCQVPAE